MGKRFVARVVFGIVAVAVAVVVPVGAAVAAVPPPAAGTAVITVKTGGERIDDDTVAPLAGVTLGLFESETAPAAMRTCVSDAEGDCSFAVDGALLGTTPWVGQVAAPTGWFVNETLRTGRASGSASVASAYRFQVPAVQPGLTYRSSRDFMYSSSNSLPTRSNGVWQQSRVNPELNARCGSDVAVVMDLSSSVGSALPQLKQAADSFADALVGTPSRLAVFSFSKQSPSVEASTGIVDTNHPNLTSVSTAAGAQAFQAQYANWGLGSGTNWDQALQQVGAADEHYDAVIMLTDGNPDRWGAAPHGDGSNTHFTDVEAAVFSANRLKASGTRVVSLGIGSGVEGLSALNLAAISGPTAFTGDNVATADYFQTTDFDGAGDQLRQLALANCTGSLSVVKQIVPAENTGEDTAGAVPAGAGWTFDAAPATVGTVLSAPAATTTDDGTGAVSFDLTPPAGSTSSGVFVAEQQQTGYTLVTQGGENASCVDLTSGAVVPVTSRGSTGFRVDVSAAAAVSCTVFNRPAAASSITVDKEWSVDGVDYADGGQPAGLIAELALTGPGAPGASPQPFGATRDGYRAGDEVSISERTRIAADGCTLTGTVLTGSTGAQVSSTLPASVMLAAGDNVYVLRNIVECAAVTPDPSPTPTPGGSTAPPAVRPGSDDGATPPRAASDGTALAFTGVDGVWLAVAGGTAAASLLSGAIILVSRRRRSARH
jgi:hypothetical protein